MAGQSTFYYLRKFNNYYNRRVKKKDSLDDYLESHEGEYAVEENKSLEVGDGIHTITTLGTGNKPWNNVWMPDYVIVATTNPKNLNVTLTRWFVLVAKRDCYGQYTLTLQRDVIADYYEQVISAPAYIQKATLQDNDPMIFNSEGMSFNQIKKSETLLQDETKTAWVVGYIPRDAFKADSNGNNQLLTIDNVPGNANVMSYDSYISRYGTGQYIRDIVKYVHPTYYGSFTNPYASGNSGIVEKSLGYDMGWYVKTGNILTQSKAIKIKLQGGWVSPIRDIIPNERLCETSVSGTTNPVTTNLFDSIDSLSTLAGRIVYGNNGKYYKIKLSKSPLETTNVKFNLSSNAGISLKTTLDQIVTAFSGDTSGKVSYTTLNNESLGCLVFYSTYIMELEEIAFETLYVRMPTPTQRCHLMRQPYDAFCIPVSTDSLKIAVDVGNSSINLSKYTASIALNIGTAISSVLGSADVYDVQLLPYCPVRQMVESIGTSSQKITSKLNATSTTYEDLKVTSNAQATPICRTSPTINNGEFIIDKNDIVGFIYWLSEDSITFNINHTITVDNVKVSNECDMYRLVSPNWNGQFEFNPAKNGGVTSFNVDMTCKPYSPYIHINPNFGLLYGNDFNDARGLICGGDFSLPLISSAWANYQLTNKNYENQFNRSIENMETNHKFSMIQQATSIVAGAGTGAASGFASTGNVAGAIAGGALSLLGGAADMALSQAQYNEQKSYAIDNYNYSLDNIKAVPYSLSKIGALNANNKIWPVLEYYTCTDEEKEALKNKLKYNGMTVMRIGTIEEFLQTDESYIQARLIRIEDIDEDFHLVQAINDELMKGVFIK